jgi:hypothetical protein
MPGLFGWGPKDETTREERKFAKDNAKRQMRWQKATGEDEPKGGHRRARRPSQDQPKPKGSLGW